MIRGVWLRLLGIALAQYVAGTKGLFEYVRYDKKKPGTKPGGLFQRR